MRANCHSRRCSNAPCTHRKRATKHLKSEHMRTSFDFYVASLKGRRAAILALETVATAAESADVRDRGVARCSRTVLRKVLDEPENVAPCETVAYPSPRKSSARKPT